MCEQKADSDLYVNERALPKDSGCEQDRNLKWDDKYLTLSSEKRQQYVFSPFLDCIFTSHYCMGTTVGQK